MERKIGEADFLELFYPIHYKIGMALEAALQAGELTRKQVSILWLIRSESGTGRSMRRKDIQRLLGTWFEISNPTITKVLYSMSRAPLSLIKVLDDPRSGREKQVVLTPKGERFLIKMVEQGRAFMRPIVAQFSAIEAREGFNFLQNVSTVHDRIFGHAVAQATAARNGRRRGRAGSIEPKPSGGRSKPQKSVQQIAVR
ncbi:MAG: winged helix DNA-binding protein [Candidatus Binataceae bacterium]|nr:winged helix DNA-binding protein [Candidatus Binataceae bacterium]